MSASVCGHRAGAERSGPIGSRRAQLGLWATVADATARGGEVPLVHGEAAVLPKQEGSPGRDAARAIVAGGPNAETWREQFAAGQNLTPTTWRAVLEKVERDGRGDV